MGINEINLDDMYKYSLTTDEIFQFQEASHKDCAQWNSAKVIFHVM